MFENAKNNLYKINVEKVAMSIIIGVLVFSIII